MHTGATSASIRDLASEAGCTDYKAEVQSDTEWTGVFCGRTVQGSCNRIVDLPDTGTPCVGVVKQTAAGFLRVRIVDYGVAAFGLADTRWVETTAPYGAAAVCANGATDCHDCPCDCGECGECGDCCDCSDCCDCANCAANAGASTTLWPVPEAAVGSGRGH